MFTDVEIELVAGCIEAIDSEFGLDDADWEIVASIFQKFGRGSIGEVTKRSMSRLFVRKGE